MTERAARYAAEIGSVDRAARWRDRLAEAREADARRRSRARMVNAVSWSTTTIAVVVIGWALLGWRGALAGGGAVAITAATTIAARRSARHRGASAWDWRAQRYRLWGDPSAEVHRRDRPPSHRSPGGR